jgi:FKBP-type peptidyl-prolyl cis-trans isomerase
MSPRSSLPLVAAVLLPGLAAAQQTEEQKTFYALGLAVARSLQVFSLTEAEFQLFQAGLADGVFGRTPKVSLDAFKERIQELAQERTGKVASEEKKAGEAALAQAAAAPGAVKTESGLVYLDLKAGAGPSPKASDRVKVHYHGTLRDGSVFDSSVQRGEPTTLPLDGVIPCWTEGLQRMKVGGKAKLVCPGSLAYGEKGSPPKIRPGAVLTFEVELLEIVKEAR